MKRFVYVILFALLITAVSPQHGFAEQQASVFVNGTKLSTSNALVVTQGTAMVPAKQVLEQLGYSVSWETATKRLISSKKGSTVVFLVNESFAFINGVTVMLTESAVQNNGAFLVPLKFFEEGLGARVTWDPKTRLATINAASDVYNKFTMELPLKVTNTAIVNLSSNALTVNYIEYYIGSGEVSSYSTSVNVAALGKTPFDDVTLKPVESAYINGEKKYYLGRAIQEIVQLNDSAIVTSNPYYTKLNDYYYSSALLKQISAYVTKTIDAYFADLKKELVKNKNIPLKVTGTSTSEDIIGTPEANIQFRNLSSKTIVAFEVSFSCYDSFNQPVKKLGTKSNRFYGVAQKVYLESGAYETYTWTLYLQDLTTKIGNITIDKVAYSDGTIWKRK